MAEYLAICARLGVNDLVAAECEALTGGKPAFDSFAVCPRIDLIPQSAYVMRGSRFITRADSLPELVENIRQLDIHTEDFTIEVLQLAKSFRVSGRQTIVAVADVLHGYPNLDAPRHSFEVVIREDGYYFGEILTRCSHSYQPHAYKPYHMSSSLPAQMARALVNLVAPPASSILDPCCGTGSILLEACSLGLAAYGCDLNPRMVGMSTKNLSHFGYTAEVQQIDARECEQQADAVVTDLPYGRFQPMEETNLRLIMQRCTMLAPLGVFVAGADLSQWLAESGYENIEVYQVRKKRTYDFTRFVHTAQSGLIR